MKIFSKLINKYTVVKQIPIFSKLNWFELHTIIKKSTLVEYQKGEIICKEGDPPDALYCLISGRLQAYTYQKDGKKENVEFLHRGMYFGIISLFTGESHSLNFEAMNDSVVLKIDKSEFLNILKFIPRLGIEFSRSLSRRMRAKVKRGKIIFESMVISVYSPLEGSGSSTYAVNLALSLGHETQKKVVFVNITSKTHQDTHTPEEGIAEASPRWKKAGVPLNDIVDDHDKILKCVRTGDLEIDLLNVVFDPQDSSLVDQISIFVSTLVNDYHYVVVDLPNHMDEVVLKTLVQSDIVHLVTLDRQEDLQVTRHVIDLLQDALKDNFDRDNVCVMISGIEAKCYLSYEEVSKRINYNVSTMLPHINRAELNVAVVSEPMTVIMPSQKSEYTKVITRIARRIGGVSVGLVLGGGAALGVAHVGVIKILESENIPIDIVVGSSMGALIGSLWVTGRNAKQLEAVAREFENKASLLKLLDPVFPKAGLLGGRLITRWLKKHLGNKTFYGTDIPLKIVAYDLVRRQELIIHEGLLTDAVRKSISIPGVIKPVVKNDQLIIDGGVLNPLPTNVLASLGIKKIIAVNVLQSPEHVSQGWEMEKKRMAEEAQIPFFSSPLKYIGARLGQVLRKLFWPNISDIIVQSLQATEYVIAEQSGQQADIVIHPDLEGIKWFELYEVDHLLKRGEQATVAQLAAIKQLIND